MREGAAEVRGPAPADLGGASRWGLRQRWGRLPVWARWVAVVYAVGFAQGACAHLLDLVRGGIHAYASYPHVAYQVYFISLVVLDPLAALLVVRLRRAGVWLACGVMITDVTANWTGNWPWIRDDPAQLLRPVGLLPITLFGLFVVVTNRSLRRAFSRTATRVSRTPGPR
ncbi:hypothetical protein [Streptomyces rimosus]|uniref:hypothetical protein n=1 Tax=Streptomyces rimosus TaxID=1927 RepID=UPI001F2CE1AF|nr:hypothetical protein [Streptomyces rimosus]